MSPWRKIFGGGHGARTVKVLRERLERFRDLVERNNQVLELIADAGEKLGGEYIFDQQYLRTLADDLRTAVRAVVYDLNALSGDRYPELARKADAIADELQAILESRVVTPRAEFVIPIDQIGIELADVVGSKMARLGEIQRRLGCRVPDGLAISAYACQKFLERSGIDELIEERLGSDVSPAPEALERFADEIGEAMARAELPRSLERAIRRGVAQLQRRRGSRTLAVRSSALGEDGDLTFAGQYRTELGVAPEQVLDAYRAVLASLFSRQVMEYRQSRGLPPGRGLMAVGCLGMVEAETAGVTYTLDPVDPDREVLLVSAAPGLGTTVVGGVGPADRFEVDRQPPHRVRDRALSRKKRRRVVREGEGEIPERVPEAEQQAPSLTDAQLRELAETALQIERFMKCAQDVEWAFSREGELYILQARPLLLSSAPSRPPSRDLRAAVGRYPTLLSTRGSVACRGIASGPVHVVTDEGDLGALPPGCVLVSRTSTPRLSGAVATAAAVITDLGTPTGHLAAIAREFRVPAIVDTGVATEVLRDAGEVTVDAEENAVYQGRVKELLHHQLLRRSSFEDAFEFRLLRRMLKRVAPLNLTDPQASNFSASHCATYHDIVRFAHEKAVARITSGTWVRPSKRSPFVRRVDLDVPLDLVVIDLGGGLQAEKKTATVRPDEVRCEPLHALLEGLTAEGVWATEPADMDLNGFMSSATRSAALTGPFGAQPEQNLAIVSQHYLNLSLHLGYHFTIVDGYLGETRNDNYLYFRFAGGVTEQTRRSRRARLLHEILKHYDFVVERQGDLVIGRIKKLAPEVIADRLRMLGRLIGFTRQLDIFLRDDELVNRCVDDFLRGEYSPGSPRPEATATEGEMSSSDRVLVLDDEAIVCERLEAHLTKAGFAVETFTDSQAAVDRLGATRFDVVVTDIKMKGPTGLDVLRFVREHSPATQVILITGFSVLETRRDAEYLGAFEFILKPFQLVEMAKLVKKAARRARKHKSR